MWFYPDNKELIDRLPTRGFTGVSAPIRGDYQSEEEYQADLRDALHDAAEEMAQNLEGIGIRVKETVGEECRFQVIDAGEPLFRDCRTKTEAVSALMAYAERHCTEYAHITFRRDGKTYRAFVKCQVEVEEV